MKNLKIIFTILILANPIFSDDDSAYKNALELFMKGDYPKTISSIAELHKTGKESFETHYLAGHANWKINEFQTAIGHWYSARKLRPDDLNVVLDLLKAHNSLGQTRVAFAL